MRSAAGASPTRARRYRRPLSSVAAVVAPSILLTALSGCGIGYDDLPTPAEPARGYEIDALFDDVLNLSTGAPVKVNGLPAGAVTAIELDGTRARVSLAIDDADPLRSGSRARLRYDTPLGEVYVEVTPAAKGEPLQDGDELDPSNTSTAPTVEDTLAQASLLINGGGLGQLSTITTELNKVLGGREGAISSGLRTTNEFLRALNDSQGDLTATLRGVRSTAILLRERRITLRKAVTRIAPAADVLRENQAGLKRLLQQSDRVAARATDLLTGHEDELLQVLQQLGPVLQAVLASEDALVASLTNVQSTADLLNEAIPGDFIGLDATLRLDLNALLTGSGGVESGPGGGPGGGGPLGLPDLTELLDLLGRVAVPTDRFPSKQTPRNDRAAP